MKQMKRYPSFDAYLDDQALRNQPIVRRLRRFVKEVAPALEESVKWGNGCWLKGKWPVAYVYSDEDHVQFGFFAGSALKDPQGLLAGQGRYVRHVKVRKLSDLDEAAFRALLLQAIRKTG
jgi:hypothetical protein